MSDKSTDGVLVDDSSLKGGTSDESDKESIFEESWSKRSNPCRVSKQYSKYEYI
jgi:hypothetical protein